MKQRRPSATRMRVLRWLLALVALVGAGALQGAHCLTNAQTSADHYSVAAGHHQHSHQHAVGVDHDSPDTALDICQGDPAPAIPATVTTVVVDPPMGLRTVPVAAPVTAPTPRTPSAPDLTDICVSRT